MISTFTELRDRFRIEQQWELRANHLPGKIMRFEPTIVHFSGHGSCDGALVFLDKGGNACVADPGALAEIFRILNKVRCVVLNACYSGPQAEAISKHIEVVIGMSSAICDTDAISFSRAFYEALGYGKSAVVAFELAKCGITLSNLTGSELPKLYARSDTDPSKIFLCEPL